MAGLEAFLAAETGRTLPDGLAGQPEMGSRYKKSF
jgi:hypothetical protein